MALQTTVEIDGVNIGSYLFGYTIEETFGDAIATCEITVAKSIVNAVDLSTGLTVEIWRGWTTPTDTKHFSGYIESFEPEGGLIKIMAKDKLWDLVRKEVTHTYDSAIDASAGKVSEIFKDLVTTYGLLTADASVQDSGTVILINKLVCNHSDIFERCKKLSDVLNWQFYYRADTDKVYFESQGFNFNSLVLTVGTNVMQVPTWTYDNTEMCNDITIVGAYQEIETTESGRIGTTSGYTTASVTISFTPISVKIYFDANNPPTTLKTGGIPGSTASYDYYIDKDNKQILPLSAFVTDDYVEIRYSHAVPIPVHMANDESIADYGQFKKTITYTDIRDMDDAEQRGANWLSKFSTPFIYTALKVKPASTNLFRAGQSIRVVDSVSVPNVDQVLVISRCRIRWPGDYDELVVGDKAFRLAGWQASVEDRLKRLHEDELANQDIIVEIVNVDNRTMSPIEMEPRYNQVQTQTVTGTNCFIIGHATYGKIGTGRLGSTDITAAATSYMHQFEDYYHEDFFDTDFKAGTTTATWTTVSTLTFTGSQIAVSLPIDYNNATVTTAKMTVTASSGGGNLTYYLSADGGSHWETVTSGTAHTFTNTGTSLCWKITSSNNAVVTDVVIEDYH